MEQQRATRNREVVGKSIIKCFQLEYLPGYIDGFNMVGGERRRSERDYHKVLRLFFRPVEMRQCKAWQPRAVGQGRRSMNGKDRGVFFHYLFEISHIWCLYEVFLKKHTDTRTGACEWDKAQELLTWLKLLHSAKAFTYLVLSVCRSKPAWSFSSSLH